MSYLIKNRFKFLFILLTMVVISCGHEEMKEPILHQNYVQGRLNNHNLIINDVNASILIDKSDYLFSSGNQTDIPIKFDWSVNLIETKDTVVTLYLHIDDLKKTNEIIYSPNEKDPIKTKSTCYAVVRDLKNNTTVVYHPTHQAPINIKWTTFMITVDKSFNEPSKLYEYDVDFTGHRWPGIEGNLDGIFTCDDALKVPIKIKIDFRLY